MMQDRDDTTKASDPLQTLLHEKAVNNAEVIFQCFNSSLRYGILGEQESTKKTGNQILFYDEVLVPRISIF